MKLLTYSIFSLLFFTSFNSAFAQENGKSQNEIVYDSLVSIMKLNSDLINEMIAESSLESDSSVMILNDLLNLSFTEIKSKYNLNPADEIEFLTAISVTNEIIEMNKLISYKLEISDSIIEMNTLKSKNLNKNDSIVEIDYDLFQELELDLKTMTKEQFESYLSPLIKDKYLNNCSLEGLKLQSMSDCDEICQIYLYEYETGKKMYLPEDYDAGILGARFSTHCKNLIIYSTYDGPDYHNYYENRAEFYVFNIFGNDGLGSIQPFVRFSMKDYSIDNLVWISDSEIGLKLYSQSSSGNESEMKYEYFSAMITISAK